MRNAVEGIPSVLRRRYHVDQIPVRGFVRSKTWFTLKIGAINVKRVLVKAHSVLFSPHHKQVFSLIIIKNQFTGTKMRTQIA